MEDLRFNIRLYDDTTDAFKSVQRNLDRTSGNVARLNHSVGAGSYQRRNLISQLNDIGVGLASGQKPFTVAIQQGSQLATIWGPDEGGLGRAFKETGALASQAATKLAPLGAAAIAGGVMFEGWTRQIQRSGHEAVSFTDVVIGAWELLLAESKSILSDQFGGLWDDFLAKMDEVVANTNREINAIVGAFVAAARIVPTLWSEVPAAVGDYAIETANIVIASIEEMINTAVRLINDFAAKAGSGLGLDVGKLAEVNLGDLKNPFQGAGQRLGKDLKGAIGDAFSTDYVGGLVSDIGKQAQKVHDRPSDKEAKAAERAAAQRQKAVDGVVKSLNGELAMLGMTNREQAIYNSLQRAGVSATSDAGKKITDLAGKLYDQRDALDALNQSQQFFADVTYSAFDALIVQGDSLTDTIDNIAKALISATLQATLLGQGPLAGLLGTKSGTEGGVGGIIGAILSAFAGAAGGGSTAASATGLKGHNALGNAFANGNIMPFAAGGVFTSPMVFPMARGMGLLGEGGGVGEGVLPLARDSAGRLGVRSNGGGGGGMTVNIINNAGAEVKTEQKRGADGSINLQVLLDKAGADNLTRGGSHTNRAAKSIFGLRQPLRKTA